MHRILLILALLIPMSGCLLPALLAGGFGYHVRGNDVYFTGGGFDRAVSNEIVEGADGKTFQILGHNYGKDSKNVWRAHYQIPGADAASFVALSEDYARDSYRAYANAVPIPGADAATFVTLGDSEYAKDKNALYVGGHRDQRFPVCDAGSLELITGHWLKDKSCVYYHGEKVEGVDPTSFKILKNELAKDDNAIYIGTERLPACDIQSFIPISREKYGFAKSEWQRDNECFYFGGKIIHNADYPTFETIGMGYAKDRNHVFYRGTIMPDADPDTFEIVNFYQAKDRNNCYEQGKSAACPLK